MIFNILNVRDICINIFFRIKVTIMDTVIGGENLMDYIFMCSTCF